MKETLIWLLFSIGLIPAYAQSPPLGINGNFCSPRIERELNYYVAANPLYSTNHFYVGAIKMDHTNMVEGLVYWKDNGILLSYNELPANASHDIFAWQGHSWRLGQDTVDTPEEINGSDYVITTHQWHDWVNQCISKGK